MVRSGDRSSAHFPTWSWAMLDVQSWSCQQPRYWCSYWRASTWAASFLFAVKHVRTSSRFDRLLGRVGGESFVNWSPRPSSCAWLEEWSERSSRFGVCKSFERSHPPICRERTSCISTLLRWPLHSLHLLLPHCSPATHQLTPWCAPTLARS